MTSLIKSIILVLCISFSSSGQKNQAQMFLSLKNGTYHQFDYKLWGKREVLDHAGTVSFKVVKNNGELDHILLGKFGEKYVPQDKDIPLYLVYNSGYGYKHYTVLLKGAIYSWKGGVDAKSAQIVSIFVKNSKSVKSLDSYQSNLRKYLNKVKTEDEQLATNDNTAESDKKVRKVEVRFMRDFIDGQKSVELGAKVTYIDGTSDSTDNLGGNLKHYDFYFQARRGVIHKSRESTTVSYNTLKSPMIGDLSSKMYSMHQYHLRDQKSSEGTLDNDMMVVVAIHSKSRIYGTGKLPIKFDYSNDEIDIKLDSRCEFYTHKYITIMKIDERPNVHFPNDLVEVYVIGRDMKREKKQGFLYDHPRYLLFVNKGTRIKLDGSDSPDCNCQAEIQFVNLTNSDDGDLLPYADKNGSAHKQMSFESVQASESNIPSIVQNTDFAGLWSIADLKSLPIVQKEILNVDLSDNYDLSDWVDDSGTEDDDWDVNPETIDKKPTQFTIVNGTRGLIHLVDERGNSKGKLNAGSSEEFECDEVIFLGEFDTHNILRKTNIQVANGKNSCGKTVTFK